MIGVPELGGDEDIFAGDSSGGESGLESVTYLALVAVAFGAIEVTESGCERVSGGGDG